MTDGQTYQNNVKDTYAKNVVKSNPTDGLLDKFDGLDSLLDDVDTLLSKDNLAKNYVQNGGQ